MHGPDLEHGDKCRAGLELRQAAAGLRIGVEVGRIDLEMIIVQEPRRLHVTSQQSRMDPGDCTRPDLHEGNKGEERVGERVSLDLELRQEGLV